MGWLQKAQVMVADWHRPASTRLARLAYHMLYTKSFIMKWLKHVSNPHRDSLTRVEYGERQVGNGRL
jgi:hypothetical protein